MAVCECGCGRDAQNRFVRGHNSKRTKVPPPRIDRETGCWIWQGAITTTGYGQTRVDGRYVRAHRVYYERVHGPIPEGLQLDHLCRNTSCVNPAHLEPVTPAENTRRGRGAKLTAAAVVEIWRRYEGWQGSTRSFAREVAPEYGVGAGAVRGLLRGERWKEFACAA